MGWAANLFVACDSCVGLFVLVFASDAFTVEATLGILFLQETNDTNTVGSKKSCFEEVTESKLIYDNGTSQSGSWLTLAYNQVINF